MEICLFFKIKRVIYMINFDSHHKLKIEYDYGPRCVPLLTLLRMSHGSRTSTLIILKIQKNLHILRLKTFGFYNKIEFFLPKAKSVNDQYTVVTLTYKLI